MEMPKAYNPKEHEDKIYQSWEDNGYFKPKIDKSKKPFVVAIPPPNVTGSLHIGHALDNTIQDVMIRYNRMKGNPTLWIPGTDHAGIATQNKVEQRLAKSGKTKHDLGREKFVEEVWKWKDEYQGHIVGQLKKLGSSCDWSRLRFTMDKDYSKSVIEAFAHYYDKGYLYRGNRIINWCPRCHTSISDLEVEHEEELGSLWYIKYQIENGKDITVATTRPETMLGDTAIAVNPADKKFSDLVGKVAILPIINRKIPIVADKAVELEFGTGAVKVTPAHDPVDFEIGERHKLEKIIIIDEDGKMTKEAGEQFFGMDRFEAREAVVKLLDEGGWLTKVEPYSHSVGHCSRCHTVVEPLLSLQWFVSMEKIVVPAISVVKKSEIKFHPNKWKKVYLDWMDNIRDWCISRQLWWGHQLPVWYCECGKIIVSKEWALEELENVSRETKTRECPKCKSHKIERDQDVLDTWFSSALWPFATLGWPEKTSDLNYFYPTMFLATARDIIFLWVARMIMSGLEFMDEPPFKDVYIHATVFNKEGKRMSKSLGTGVDPLDLMEKYGTDAMRFGLLWQTAQGQDMKFGEDAILNGQRFANKIWNASRFVMMNLDDYKIVTRETIKDNLTKEDKLILDELEITIKQLEKYFSRYDFQHAVELIYEFFWHNFCDKYIEVAKIRIRKNDKTKSAAQYTLDKTLKDSLKMLHPFMPFVTEAIWENLNQKKPLIISDWPKYQ
ncbi:MAG: valine--tRNA ligase [Patescibacteria group bacterium]|jgi:valyl-tRNA synthetase|nr:valine--tRNA ligase [Patescibacteria group bacterium]